MLANQATVIEARMRHFGIERTADGVALARQPDMGSFIGRLYQGREISLAQYEAARWWEAMAFRARYALGVRRVRDSCDFSVRGRPVEDEKVAAERDRRALEAYRDARKAVSDPMNPRALEVLQSAVEADQGRYEDLGTLRVALNAVARDTRGSGAMSPGRAGA